MSRIFDYCVLVFFGKIRRLKRIWSENGVIKIRISKFPLSPPWRHPAHCSRTIPTSTMIIRLDHLMTVTSFWCSAKKRKNTTADRPFVWVALRVVWLIAVLRVVWLVSWLLHCYDVVAPTSKKLYEPDSSAATPVLLDRHGILQVVPHNQQSPLKQQQSSHSSMLTIMNHHHLLQSWRQQLLLIVLLEQRKYHHQLTMQM